jgi:streptogramin lyase
VPQAVTIQLADAAGANEVGNGTALVWSLPSTATGEQAAVYNVTISNVLVDGQSENFSYTTTTFTPNPIRVASAFPIPTASSASDGITAGPDGNLWFTEQNGNQIGMINPTTHVIAEFPIPTANSAPDAITTGPDGNLWFTESYTFQIGILNPTTRTIAEHPVPFAAGSPQGITTGPDGNVWITADNQIVEFPPGATAAVPVPTLTPAPTAAPPQVVGSVAVSRSRRSTTYTITFAAPLNVASANTASLYRVFEGMSKVVKKRKQTVYSKALKIKSVVYNPGPITVTIALAKPHKGTVQVTIEPGLEAADSATLGSSITRIVP